MKKNLLIYMIIIAIIVIILTITIMILNNKEGGIKEDKHIEHTDDMENDEVTQLKTPLVYYHVNEAIKKYIMYIQVDNTKAIESILSDSASDELKRIIRQENYAYIDQIYALDQLDNMIFYVKSVINGNSLYLIVNIDYSTYAFQIYHSTQEEYNNAINGKINQKYKRPLSVKQNEYNQLSRNVTDISIIQMYYDHFKDILYYETEKSFDKIDAEYKLQKFNNNLEDYKKYMNDNMDRIMESNIIEYWLEEENGNPKYVFRDTNDNYITIEVKENIIDYTILLDNYTIETEEFKEKYNKADAREKIGANIAKVFKWIDEKEYEKIYEHLDETFKKNTFPSINSFATFINNKFFDRNVIQTAQINQQGNNYIVTINYTSNQSVAAENGTQMIVMQLKEGTDFVMSFNIE